MSTVAMQPTACEQLRDKASALREDLREIGSLAPDAAREKFRAMKSDASQCMESARERVADAKEGVEEFIRERPIQSVMIAAGAGVLVGLLLSRR